MKRILIGTALALFGLAPAIGSACEYNDVTMASATPPAQLGLANAPAASKAPAPVVAEAPVKEAKQVGGKAPSSAPQTSLASLAKTN